MFRRLATSAAALTLALGSLVALSAPASAANRIPCPTHTGFFSGIDAAWKEVKERGRLIDEYFVNQTAVQVYLIDGRYEMFGAAGLNRARHCYDSKPERPANARDRWRESTGGGGGGGGGYVRLGAGAWYLGNANVPLGVVTVGPVEDLN